MKQTGCHRLRGQVTSLSFDELVNLYPFFYVTWTFWTFSVFIKKPKPKNGPFICHGCFLCLWMCWGSIQTLSQQQAQETGSWLQGGGFEAGVWGHPTLHVITNRGRTRPTEKARVFIFCPDTQVIPRCNTFLNTNMQTHADRKELNSQQCPSDRGQG